MSRLFTLTYFIAFAAYSVFSQNHSSAAEQFRVIDNEPDSIAFISLTKMIKEQKLSDKEFLTAHFRLMNRAMLMRKFKIALETGNESVLFAEKKGLDSAQAMFIKFIGILNYSINRKKECVPYFEKAMAIAHKNDWWELEASCYNNLGAAVADLKQISKAVSSLLKSIEIMTTNGKPDAPATIRSYRILATLYANNGQAEKAEQLFLSLIDKCKQKKEYGLLSDNLMFYSAILSKRGEHEKALAMSAEALEYRRKLTNLNDIQAAMSIHIQNLRKAGKADEAIDLVIESKELQKKVFAKDLEKEISLAETKYRTIELVKEKEMAELTARKQKQIYFISITALLILSIFGIIVWNQQKKSKHVSALAEADKLRFKEVIEAEEKERSRMAQELHDGLGQLLSVARLNVAGLEDAVAEEEKSNLDRSLKIIDEACVEVRNISHNLMPSALIRLGLIPAINELVNNVNAAKGIKIDFQSNIETSLGKSLDIMVYRVIQEILNNMIRHAKASHINMVIEKNNDMLKISIKDDGIGFDPEELKNSQGIGWKNIFSRISMMNGDIKLESEPQKGTLVFIHLKLKNG